MRGRARSKKIEDLMRKFTSNKDQKRPVSESKVSNKGRRRSQLMDILASRFENTPGPTLTNEKISQILKESKMVSVGEDSIPPFLETRSNIDKSEMKPKDEEVAFTMMPIYPEQIYFNNVVVSGEPMEKEKERRTTKFGGVKSTHLGKSELSVSVSPMKLQKGGKKLISQSSLGQKIKKGAFMTEEESKDLMRRRDAVFTDKMRDTQGNAIQKAKHAFLNQDDRVLRKKLLDALRNQLSKMIVKDKTVEELQSIYKKKEQDNGKKKVKDWLAFTRTSYVDEKKNKNLNQIGKIDKNLMER